MRIITLVNPKGGSGKTTLAINLASILARRGSRTLLIDLNPQGDCAPGLAVPQNRVEHTAIDLLEPERRPDETLADWTWQISRNLDLLPSTEVLARWAMDGGEPDRQDTRLARRLAAVGDRYAYCIIDTPPALGRLTWLALQSSEEWVFPVECDYLGLHGAVKQVPLMLALADQLVQPTRLTVVANRLGDRSRLSREILDAFKQEMGRHMSPLVVHEHESIREAIGFGQPVCEYQANGAAHQELEKLTDYLLERSIDKPEAGEQVPPQAKPAGRAPVSRAAELAQRARELAMKHGSEAMKQRLRHEKPPAARSDETAAAPSEPRREHARTSAGPDLLSTTRAIEDTRPGSRHDEERDACLLELSQADQPTARSPFTSRFARLFGVRETARGLLFVQPDRIGRGPVQLVGDFTSGQEQTISMTHDRELGIWQTLVQVKPGRYHYRILVDGQAMPDPHNRHVEVMGEKGSLSVVEVKGQAEA
ncbi:MAG: AAA family ATPase [Phycisphaeraceae bacterium]|nr:AAA family ATPase [Phycisphaeraceae bacterium]